VTDSIPFLGQKSILARAPKPVKEPCHRYIAFIFLSGWLVDRFNVNLILAGGFLVWSLATAATGLARGFAALFAFRLLLSIGESVAFPSVSKTCLAMFLKCIAVSPMVWFPAG